MVIEKLSIKELFASFDDATSQVLQLVSSFDEKQINTIPFEGSWTAGQVAEHLIKSNTSVEGALKAPGQIAEREADKRVPELKAMFLDFTTKLKSPAFVLPKENNYEKEPLTARLKNSVEHLNEARAVANLSETVSDAALGEMTKLEMLHFVVYHTQRHIHQLTNISKKVKQGE